MWSQRVIDQARACGFEAELIVAEGEGLSVGDDVFDRSDVDPVRFQNVHIAWMTLINRCKKWQMKLFNAAKHQMTLGETSNYTIKPR